jgi:hypothetical protein
MSDLIVIGYETPQTGRQAYEQVQRLQQGFVVELRGLAIVDVDGTPSAAPSSRPRCPRAMRRSSPRNCPGRAETSLR